MGNMHTWTYDAPTGTFKNHYVSENLRDASIENAVFMRYVEVEGGYGKRMGESVTIPRSSNLSEPTEPRITESVGIPIDKLTLSTTSITVKEFGRGVEFTNFNQDLSKVDIPAVHKRALMKQMKLSLDTAAASAFKDAKVKAIPTGVADLTWDTDGTASTAATVNLNFYHMERIRDYLFNTLNAEPFMDGDYIGIFNTKSVRGLKDDPKFEEWNKYTNREAKMNGEVGRIEGIRVIETNHTNALSATKGTGSVLGEGVVFGAQAVTMAVAEDPELRMAQPSDFGRKMAVAWYGILEFGLIWDTANAGEASVVHVTSS